MTDQEKAYKENEVANWMKSKGYDRRAYKDIVPIIVKWHEEQLAIDGVVVPKGTLKTFEGLPCETKDYRKSDDAIVWKNK